MGGRDAAATKPFGFMRFTPGPGLGGHCIPLDPFYLSWRARQFDFHTEFIELAGKVNQNMPYFCREKVAPRPQQPGQAAARTPRCWSLGVAYKPDIDDTRESPALKLIELLRAEGCTISYHDPYVPRAARVRAESVDRDVPARGPTARRRHRPLLIDYADLVQRAPSWSSTSATPRGARRE